RPGDMEIRAIRLLIDLCRRTRCRTHIVHLSNAEALADIENAKAEGLPLTVETCPHYLTFCSEDVPPGATQFKCAPPIRSAENREALWRGLGRGIIDFVVSDHSPCVPELKKQDTGDFLGAWGGISGLQFTLPATLWGAVRRGYNLEDVVRWTAENTAAFVGLASKGRLEKGRDADLTILDDAELFDLTSDCVKHRHALTPYEGLRLPGVAEATYVRGLPAYEKDRPAADARGRVLLKGA
ncbi:MAG: amidohydrolase family protein, partial [Elusimicrobia bacterium]|nr:amidohydrolase family protein [Elusimicrobiota bacterium]